MPDFPDKKSLRKATQKQTFSHWDIRIYATEKPITYNTRYIVLLKHKCEKTKQWMYPDNRGFSSTEEAYVGAILWIARHLNLSVYIGDTVTDSFTDDKTS
jgi:hypothetical protein